jgi:hypothetical protein
VKSYAALLCFSQNINTKIVKKGLKMTSNNNNNEEETGSFSVTVPKKISVAVLFALIIQIVCGIWIISGVYYSRGEIQNKFSENMKQVVTQLTELKSSIYTRNEALLQFEAVRQENVRQDLEIREIRSKVYGK